MSMKVDDEFEASDVLISMWCDGVTAHWSKKFGHKKIITWLRRYELWEKWVTEPGRIDFSKVDAIVFVNQYYREAFKRITAGRVRPKKSYIIYNGVDTSEFPYKNRDHGHKIAMMCSVKNVKNLPLAAQIINELPSEYKIYHVGWLNDSQIAGQIFSYINNLGLRDRFVFEGKISREQVPAWLDDKNYILSTSINEGNPNNVIEAMAMGIKPVIHDWPGARSQFLEECIFRTVSEACDMISPEWLSGGGYDSSLYHDWVEEKYSLNNFKKIHEVICDVMEERGSSL